MGEVVLEDIVHFLAPCRLGLFMKPIKLALNELIDHTLVAATARRQPQEVLR